MNGNEYLAKIREIESFPLDLAQRKSISKFVNLSSGAAAVFGEIDARNSEDIYGFSKHESEKLFRKVSYEKDFSLINCRIYSISGKRINEFNNLAISSFIQQAISDLRQINVKSPSTRRTYVDASNLVEVLLKLALDRDEYLELDSGGELVTFSQLAKIVAKYFDVKVVLNSNSNEQSQDYFGDF